MAGALQGQTDKTRPTIPPRRILVRTCSAEETKEWRKERSDLIAQLKNLLDLTKELDRQNRSNIALAKEINEAYKKLIRQVSGESR